MIGDGIEKALKGIAIMLVLFGMALMVIVQIVFHIHV